MIAELTGVRVVTADCIWDARSRALSVEVIARDDETKSS